MGLSLWLINDTAEKVIRESKIYIRENGQNREISEAEWKDRFPNIEPVEVLADNDAVFQLNITHNLSKMASEAWLYHCMWEAKGKQAASLIEPLKVGITRLKGNPEHYKAYNPANGWGDYFILLQAAMQLLEACIKYPDARVDTWR